MTNPWYKDGICFTCKGCGGCCSGEPGYVWINDEEVTDMAKHLKVEKSSFLSKYTRQAQDKTSLIEKPNYDCIFLNNGSCDIYDARPIQCRTYPFWNTALASREDFIEATENCPGTSLDINCKDFKLYKIKEIEKISASSTL